MGKSYQDNDWERREFDEFYSALGHAYFSGMTFDEVMGIMDSCLTAEEFRVVIAAKAQTKKLLNRKKSG